MNLVVQIIHPQGIAYAILNNKINQYYQTCYKFRERANFQQIRVRPGDGSQWFTDKDQLTYNSDPL